MWCLCVCSLRFFRFVLFDWRMFLILGSDQIAIIQMPIFILCFWNNKFLNLLNSDSGRLISANDGLASVHQWLSLAPNLHYHHPCTQISSTFSQSSPLYSSLELPCHTTGIIQPGARWFWATLFRSFVPPISRLNPHMEFDWKMYESSEKERLLKISNEQHIGKMWDPWNSEKEARDVSRNSIGKCTSCQRSDY